MTQQSPLKAADKEQVPISKPNTLSGNEGRAPIYDWIYGKITSAARKAAVGRANRLSGRLLEIGVGTGLALIRYSPRLDVVGIDLSPHMLAQARLREEVLNRKNITGLSQMDAGALAFADNSFDVVTAICAVTTAPDPGAVLAELGRVVRPGGEIILVNRFSRKSGVGGFFDRLISGFNGRLGQQAVFPVAHFIDIPGLTLTNTRNLPPFGLFTLLGYRKNKPVVDHDQSGAQSHRNQPQ